MIAVIFEVYLDPERQNEYLKFADELREQLIDIDGFISVERFSSLSNAGKICSLSFWEDEAAVERWRNLDRHRLAQQQGRDGLFLDYRIRVAKVLRDYGMEDRAQAPTRLTKNRVKG